MKLSRTKSNVSSCFSIGLDWARTSVLCASQKIERKKSNLSRPVLCLLRFTKKTDGPKLLNKRQTRNSLRFLRDSVLCTGGILYSCPSKTPDEFRELTFDLTTWSTFSPLLDSILDLQNRIIISQCSCICFSNFFLGYS